MTPEQKKNLLNHADFMERVVDVQTENGLNMYVYFADVSPTTIKEKEEEGEEVMDILSGYQIDPDEAREVSCGFTACAIGWASKNPDLPKPEDTISADFWCSYSKEIFGINNNDHGEYCFGAGLGDMTGATVAARIREVVAAYPRHLMD